MKSLEKQCPGSKHPKHTCHQEVAGSAPGVGQISTFAGQYTSQFVHAVLNTVPAFQLYEASSYVECSPCTESQAQEVLMSRSELSAESSHEQIKKVLDRLRRNLGNPPGHDLVRILKRAHASEKVKALNIVCHGSCYQMVIPFFHTETSQLLKERFNQYWVRVFGPPKAVVIDQAQTNMGEALQNHLDLQGTEVRQIAGEAHWQLGRTEVHGGWFARVLTKILVEHSAATKEGWEECVIHAHVKNQMI